MGTIKDISDLTTQLLKSVKDREMISIVTRIQSLTNTLQSENMSLASINLELKEKIFKFEKEISNLKEAIKKMKDDEGGGFASGVVVTDHF